jgi:PBP1b-binding outer membrane lipoprotein LpoB
MNFKLLSSLLLSLFLLVGCSQSGEGDDSAQNETTTENNAPADGQAMPGTSPSGDTEVSDEELERFVALSQELQMMSQQVQQDMIAAVEEEGLDLQRFSEMDKADRNPATELEGTPQELESFEAANERLNTMQTEARESMQSKLEAQGFTEQRLQEINMALQQDTVLQKRFRSLQQATMQQQMQQQMPTQ